MGKPTDGPWHWYEDSLYDAQNNVILSDDYGQISEANQALVCAAPTLLTACQAALELCDALGPNMVGTEVPETLRVAIAKALGTGEEEIHVT